MFSIQLIVACCAVAVFGAPTEDGKWHPEHHGGSGKNLIETYGKYLRPPNEGKYVHIPNPYIHDDNPYDGGYGPYAHQNEPYVAEASVDRYRYVLTPNEDLPYYKDGYYRNNGIKILEQEFNKKHDKYDYKFKTENKIRAAEQAVVKNPNSIDEGIASAGFYEYIGPDGFMYRVDYTADENGFRPKLKRLETPYSGKWTLEKV